MDYNAIPLTEQEYEDYKQRKRKEKEQEEKLKQEQGEKKHEKEFGGLKVQAGQAE